MPDIFHQRAAKRVEQFAGTDERFIASTHPLDSVKATCLHFAKPDYYIPEVLSNHQVLGVGPALRGPRLKYLDHRKSEADTSSCT